MTLLDTNTAEKLEKEEVEVEETEVTVDAPQPHGNVDGSTHVIEAADQFPRGHIKVSLGTRVLEIIFAAFVLITGIPVMFIIGAIIKRGSPGPVVFRQNRVGIGRKPFPFIKFRTMYADARERYPELYAYRYSSQDMQEMKFKIEEDPRVTAQGEWLRKTSLDELPNFWNVITGDMALVGPRPEIPEMLPYYKGEMLDKFTVRPGVTGLAQISGRGRLGFYDTVDLDLEYVHNRSFMYDLKILLLTMKQVFLGDGAF